MSRLLNSVLPLARQFSTFFGVGLVSACMHFGVLIGLVELFGFKPVPATLVGYTAGGFVSYVLNRRHTYASERPHAEATWRFAVVAGLGLLLTWALMALFIRLLGPAYYIPAQLVTTGIVLVWHFLAHKLWTFAHPSPSAAKGEG